MTTTFAEPGTDATQAFEFFSATTGAITSDTSTPHTGPRAIKCDTGAGDIAAIVAKAAVVVQAGSRISFWVRLAALPTSGVMVLAVVRTATVDQNIYFLGIDSSGVLTLYDGFGNSLGTGSTLSIDIYYQLTLTYTISSTTVHSEKVFLGRNQDISAVNASTLPYVAAADMFWGICGNVGGANGANKVAYIDDIYVDDGTGLNDIGDVRVTAKLPNSVVHDLFTGAGVGDVNQRPINVATINDYQSHTATSQVHQDYDIQAASAGDVNLTGLTIRALTFWIWAKSGTGTVGTPKMIYQADTEQAITLSSAAYGLFTRIVDTITYPSAGASVIGMESSGEAADSFLGECGVLVTYMNTPSLYPRRNNSPGRNALLRR